MGSSSSSLTFPKGFRFHPTNEEVLSYLEMKNQGRDSEITAMIPEINLCRHDPPDLPALVLARGELLDREWYVALMSWDRQWYFYSRRDYKYIKSTRSNRTTRNGYWKITGKELAIKAPGSKAVIGIKRTLTFYVKRGVPKPQKTNWVLHEFDLTKANSDDQIGDFVLCRLKYKSDDSDHDKQVCDGGETGTGMASNVENQAAAEGLIAEAGENLAIKEPGDAVWESDGNEHQLKGLQTDPCGKDRNDLPISVEGQSNSCNSSDSDTIKELHDKPENLDSPSDQPPPPQPQSPQKLGNVSPTTNAHIDECRKRKVQFGDNNPSPTKQNHISTNDVDELASNTASNSINQAADAIPEGCSQPGENLGSDPFQSLEPLSINRELRDFSHYNNSIGWDDMPIEGIDFSLVKFLDTVIDEGSSDGHNKVVCGLVNDCSTSAIGATLQCS
ncbi:putative transcription factor NAM family [Rosa chinensis]|uniref:Putative transcription factor NAM family n=1 Tax=Rosa chinensis TaxID=74649 RepID=A0A2P6SJ13_ROSCH|nr:NAC domain containing protein 52 [Rosa chinensis]PRQ58654.1 putative transcription factor NAM family [Rosa chinensis]